MVLTYEPELSKINDLLNYGRLYNNTLIAINRIIHGLELNERHQDSLNSMKNLFDEVIRGEGQNIEIKLNRAPNNVSSLNAYRRMTLLSLRDILRDVKEENEVKEYLMGLRDTLISFISNTLDLETEENINSLMKFLGISSETCHKEIERLRIEEVELKPWETREEI
ncbi:MAG: hypothetical protein ACFFB5_17450 [Promethearchaeota archaeon]